MGNIDLHHPRLDISGDGETVILLNGLLQSKSSWAPFVRLLTPFYRVVCYDLRNQGSPADSLWDEEVKQDHAGDLADLVEALGGRPITVVGQSFGARIALDFAARYPEKVDRLVLAAMASPSLAARYSLVFSNWLRALPEDSDDDWLPFAEAVVPWAFGARYLQEQPDFVNLYAGNIRTTQRRAGIAANLRALLEANSPEGSTRFASLRINVPALVVNGADDYLTPPDQLDQALRILPRATFQVLQQCGHAVSVEGARDFERLTLDFLLA